MAVKLRFQSVVNQTIFQPEFRDFSVNGYNTIEFKKQSQTRGGIAVIYAPNGTGKSSLAAVLGNKTSQSDLSFEAIDEEGNRIAPETNSFHIIGDQISRNVIKGETTDYLMGQNIQREYELKKNIAEGFRTAFNQLKNEYKRVYNVTKVGDYLLRVIQEKNPTVYSFIREIVNQKSKGSTLNRGEFLEYVRTPENRLQLEDVDDDKRQFVLSTVDLVEQLMNIDSEQIVYNADVKIVEENNDAINILKKYKDMSSCIICDNDHIDRDLLLERKTTIREKIYESLDEQTKNILEKIVMDQRLLSEDPFEIKNIVLEFLASGDIATICQLRERLNLYITHIISEMINRVFTIFEQTSIYQWWDEYTRLLESQPEIDSEELLFIQEVIGENIGHDIRITRDEENDHNFKLMFDDRELLGLNREEMHLSTGEQNFISLTFELLLARNSKCKFIILDDPISSFDSIYKNKIAFCIIKFLENKQQIILTHNTDLIRLLYVQIQDCFNLYILNNADDGRNGFIPVQYEEKKILINLSDLVKLFQNKEGILERIIRDRKLFLMSVIPFLRGYMHIVRDENDDYGNLSKLMHGYETQELDVAKIYNKAFGYEVKDTEIISVNDILNLSTVESELDIIDSTAYPLLADTLKQTLLYYHIRMKVEYELVNIFGIRHAENNILQLTDIIGKAFPITGNMSPEQKDKVRRHRVFFTSRKTLLNEFNHFEGNMNIFQPAIDITKTALQKEIADIEKKLADLRVEYTSE